MPYRRKYPVKRRRKFAKRWYIDAGVGSKVPFIGGSSFRAGSGGLTKRSLNKMIKAAGETKKKLVEHATLPLVHNTIYTMNPFGNIPIGTGEFNRISNSIFVKKWAVSLAFTNLNASSFTTDAEMRVLLIKSDADYLSGIDAISNGIGGTEIFEDFSTNLNTALVDTDKCNVLFDKIYTITGDINHIGNIEFKQTFFKDMQLQYATATGNYLKNTNYYLVFIPYQVGGSTGVTAVGEIKGNTVVYFTD